MKPSNQLIMEMAKDLEQEVAKIENKPIKTTKNNYGDYIKWVSLAKDKATALIVATALVKAGANVAGVQAALLAQFGE
jgi:predicted hydrolase (HD superfamily)